MFNIDNFIPNFKLFVFVLTPMILIFLFIMVMISKWYKRPKGQGKSWAQLMGYIPTLYLLSPMIETYQYMVGERSDFIDRLFSWHFPIMMFLIIIVGISQVCYYWVSMGPSGEVNG